MSAKRSFRPIGGATTTFRPMVPLFALALVVLVAVGVLLSHNGTPGTSTASAATGPALIHHTTGSYAVMYTGFADLKHAADGAVIGTVVGKVGSRYAGPDAFLYTDWRVRIVTVVFDKQNTLGTGTEITVRQWGGTDNGEVYIDDDDPAMKVGDRALFFLSADSQSAGTNHAFYRTAGGPQGRFPSVNGMLTGNSMKSIRFKSPLSETQVTNQIQALPA